MVFRGHKMRGSYESQAGVLGMRHLLKDCPPRDWPQVSQIQGTWTTMEHHILGLLETMS